jgi:hypothetical protein
MELAQDRHGYASAWRLSFSFLAVAMEVAVIVLVVGARLH